MKKNIPLYKSLKFKINLLVTIIFLVIIVLLIYKSNQNQHELIRMNEDNLNQIAVETIDRRFKVSYQILETGLAQIIVNPLIVDAIALGDPDNLFNLVSQSHEKLKDVGVDEFHFFLPDNSSLLNTNEYKNGEINTTCERSIVKDINSDPKHRPISGVEECRHGLFIRYIAPIYNNNEYIGCAELGMEVESRILNIFKKVSGGEWYLYSLNGLNTFMMGSTLETDNYPIDINNKLASSLNKGEIFKSNESPYIIQMIPVSNYKGEYKNYFKRIFDNTELIALQREYTREYIIYGVLAALIGIILLWIVMTYLLNPLIYLEQKVRKLELGALDEPIKVKSNDEIGYLAGAMENMRQSLYKRESDLREQSYIDPLIGVYNRLCFEHTLSEIIEKGSFPTTLIMADIDGLKQINDTDGHTVGDDYIIKCAETMKRAMRGTDKLFRIGGDEFILLFPSTDQKTGEFILKRIKKEIETYNKTLKENETTLSISFGVGVCESESDSLENAIALADVKMYEDKAIKKNRIFSE